MLFRTIILMMIGFSFILSQVKEVTVLHWNDFHSRNMPYKITKKDSLGNEYSVLVGGSSGMLGYLNKYRNSKSLVVNGGDDFQGSPISSITKGGSQIELLNYYELDAFVLGNHEFDYSQESLDSVLDLADFKYLSANTYYTRSGKTFGRPYIVKKINGVRIGIIGITTPELHEVSLPANVNKIVLLNTDSVIAVNIKKLKKKKCDIIALLSHCGLDYDKEFAAKFYKDLDLIIGGHSHTPIFKPEIVNGVVIVQAGSNSRYLGKLDLKVNTKKDTIVYNYGKLIETILDSNINDWNIQRKVNELLTSIAPEMNRVIGILTSDWNIRRNEEGNLGHFQADAFKKRTGTDIAFLNGSGIRRSLPAGNIIVNDIWEINPFGNEVMSAEIKGVIMKKMFQNFIEMRINEMDKGSGVDMLQVSGIYIEYDAAKKGTDDFIKMMNINDIALNEDKIYTVSTNSFVASQFPKFFGDVNVIPIFKFTGLIDRDIIIDEIIEQKVINTDFKTRLKDISGKY